MLGFPKLCPHIIVGVSDYVRDSLPSLVKKIALIYLRFVEQIVVTLAEVQCSVCVGGSFQSERDF